MNENSTNTSPEDGAIDLLDFLRLVAENARLLIFGPLAVGLIALAATFVITPTYTAVTRIVTPQQQQSMASAALAQLLPFAGLVSNLKNPADIYIALLKTRLVTDRMVDRFKLMEVYGERYREDARQELIDETKATSGKDGLITLKVGDSDPVRASKMANAYIEELSAVTRHLAITEAQQRRVFFEKRLTDVKKDLVTAEAALGSSGVSVKLLKSEPGTMARNIAYLEANVVAREVHLSTMRGYLTENSPDVRRVRMEIEALRAQLVKAEQNVPAGSDTDYTNRYRNFKYQETLFEQLAKQYELAKIDESREGALIQVVDVADPPEMASKPKKTLIAILSVLVSGIVLLLFVYIRRSLRIASQNPEGAAKLAAIRSGFSRMLKRGHQG